MKQSIRPFHSESDRDYHAWVGLYIGTWSAFEHSLYMLIRTASLLTPHKREKSNAIPLYVKLKHIRKMFDTLDSLSQEREEAFAICDFTEGEAEFRHNLIHGINAEFYKRDPWYSVLWRPERTGGKVEDADVLHVTENDLREHYDGVGMAGLAVVGLTSRLQDLVERRLRDLEQRANAG